MKTLKRVLIGVVALVLLLVAVAYALPRQVHVERSTTIEAPPEAILPYLNGFARFNEWSPWADKDPDAKYTFEGPDEGVGAKMTWSGNRDVGQGSQTIVESTADRVTTELDFGPQGKATASFLLAPAERGTRVTWTMDSDMGMNPIGRWMGLFFDSMLGGDYEEGLARLKAKVEGADS